MCFGRLLHWSPIAALGVLDDDDAVVGGGEIDKSVSLGTPLVLLLHRVCFIEFYVCECVHVRVAHTPSLLPISLVQYVSVFGSHRTTFG